MKEIKIANYSVYTDGIYDTETKNFIKRYNGVRVNVNNSFEDTKHLWLSIYSKKGYMIKSNKEVIHKLVFNDEELSINCDFDNTEPLNKSSRVLVFEKKVYDELKKNIPLFLSENKCEFDTVEEENSLILEF